jgi:hypothetical protein
VTSKHLKEPYKTRFRRYVVDVRRKARDASNRAAYSLAMSNKYWAGEDMMVNAKTRRPFSESFSAKSIALVAGLLILSGIVFQLGELGYGHVNPANLWLISVVSESAWNVLAMRANGPALDDILRFWPLMLVSLGLGILAAANGASPREGGKGRRHD